MNVSIVYKDKISNEVLDDLAKELPVIISGVLEVPGGNLAILKPEQISLVFSEASVRDVGSDIKIMLFARSNNIRAKSENKRSKAILEKVHDLIVRHNQDYSLNVRLYLMEIGAAESV